MTQNYLLATDGSETSKGSEEYVSRILDPEKATIHLVYVVELFDKDKISEISLSFDVDELQRRHEEKAREILDPRAERLEELGFDVKTEIIHGQPGPEICRRAEELDVDGIFIGRGRHSQLGEIFYGSVSHYVILKAKTSVIITPTE